jgi:hypothetical protein
LELYKEVSSNQLRAAIKEHSRRSRVEQGHLVNLEAQPNGDSMYREVVITKQLLDEFCKALVEKYRLFDKDIVIRKIRKTTIVLEVENFKFTIEVPDRVAKQLIYTASDGKVIEIHPFRIVKVTDARADGRFGDLPDALGLTLVILFMIVILLITAYSLVNMIRGRS